jgi:phage-related protein
MKPVHRLGDSRKAVSTFPPQARRLAGWQLYFVQRGDDPIDWNPMSSIGPGVREIRIHAEGEYRVIYIASIGNAVYVLHAFGKKTQRTPKADIDLARQRLKQLRAALREG